jgi:hypothetical protein
MNDQGDDTTNKETKEIHGKKKRGRKPKKFINVNVNTNNEIKKNYIIKLNNNINLETDTIESYEKEDVHDSNINSNNSELCWNCCHPFHNIIYGLPLKYINNIFYIYGDFCSLECSMKYAYDNLKYKNVWELFSIINLYNKKFNKNMKPVKMAQSKLLLQKFGGHLTIEEYRENFNKNELYTIQLPPIIPINHISETYELNNNNNHNNHNYKLYRKKKQDNKKNIKNTMELEIK